MEIKQNERIEDLMVNSLKLIQDKTKYRFTTDSVLLSAFAIVKPNDVLVDFCTGSGVVPILIAGKTKCLKKFYAVELQQPLFDIARRNIELNKMHEIGEAVHCSVQDSVKYLIDKKITVITVNPPYSKVGSGLQSSDNGIAIARTEIMLSLSELVSCSAKVLSTGGRLNVVHMASRSAELISQMYGCGIVPKKIRFVQPKLNQAPHLVLIEGVKGGGDGVAVMPPLIIENDDGSESNEIKHIYSRETSEVN